MKSSADISGPYWQNPVYNALGQRVEDYQDDGVGYSMTLTYPRDIFGQRTGTYDQRPKVNWAGWDVYWSQVAGQRLNMGGSSAYIDHSDAVGSTTMETDPSGTVDWDVVHYPWGRVFQEQGTRQSEVAMGLDWQVNDPDIPSASREYSFRVYRWMTPDPGGVKVVKLDNPQTWNMYAYVGNNPTSRNDPSGLYNFENSCEKDNKECNAQFKKFRREFKKSLKEIKHARNALGKGSEERKRLDAVLRTYGKEGDNNGVTVSNGLLPGSVAAATVGSAVTFDMSKNANVVLMAINAGHEGTHVMDILDPRSSTFPLSAFSVEYRGYETSAWVAQGLGLQSLSAGSYDIYTRGQGFNDAATTNMIMDVYPSFNPGTSYLDPLPYHDPWDQQ